MERSLPTKKRVRPAQEPVSAAILLVLLEGGSLSTPQLKNACADQGVTSNDATFRSALWSLETDGLISQSVGVSPPARGGKPPHIYTLTALGTATAKQHPEFES